MYVPVQPRARVERGVGPWEEVRGEGRGDVFVGYVVEGEGEEDLVNMKRERVERQVLGERLAILR